MNTPKTIKTQAPSNIAFVKYWGKTNRQHPINPSLSMTLSQCVTSCEITYIPRQNDDSIIGRYMFEGCENSHFKNRIEKYLSSIIDVCPMLSDLTLDINTSNTFPHSSGIASSASAFAAIAYNIAHMEHDMGLIADNDIDVRASTLARLGSGSACRSINGPYTTWGVNTDEYAMPLDDIHPNFAAVNDTILLINTDEKKVSSSAGHALMDNHPYRQARIDQAKQNTSDIITAMQNGDWDKFGEILENEALSLHGLMMTSNPSFILLSPNSLQAIECIRNFRYDTKIPLYFTIDAGPNIHLIYPDSDTKIIHDFIDTTLAPLCEDRRYIHDKIGKGACIIND